MSYDYLERKILHNQYKMHHKVLYGGLMFGGLAIPTNFIKIIFSTIFPPIGEICNIISDHIVSEFPFITWRAITDLISNIHRVVYCLILTSLFYIPGLIYTLSNIRIKNNKVNNTSNNVIKINKLTGDVKLE